MDTILMWFAIYEITMFAVCFTVLGAFVLWIIAHRRRP